MQPLECRIDESTVLYVDRDLILIGSHDRERGRFGSVVLWDLRFVPSAGLADPTLIIQPAE